MKGVESTKTEDSGDFEESSFFMSLSRVFSAKGLGTPEQHEQTLHSTASDTFKAKHKRTFFSFCRRHHLCGILFSLWLLFQSQRWLGFWQFPVRFSNGKVGKSTNSQRKTGKLALNRATETLSDCVDNLTSFTVWTQTEKKLFVAAA